MLQESKRPFPVRFLGRVWFWLFLLASAAIALGGFFYWRSLRDDAGQTLPMHESSWFLWSGLVVGAMYLAAYVFSLRKWSICLRFFRTFGSHPRADMDGLWSGVKNINRMVVSGTLNDIRDIRTHARRLLRSTHTAGIRKAVVRNQDLGEGLVFPLVTILHREPLGRLEIWLEVHAAFGAVGCLGSLLHADFSLHSPLGWGMTGLSLVVFLTGVYGLWMYRFGPPMLARAAFGIPYEEAALAASDLREAIEKMAPRIAAAPFDRALLRARTVLRPGDERLTQALAASGEDRSLVRDVLVLADIRRNLLRASGPSRRIDLYLRAWKYVHVPAAILLLALLLVHVFMVMAY